MALLATDAIVLHAFDYLESSKILRLVTRDGGMRSVLAKGARRSSRRFGSGLDLFAQGTAQLYAKPGRDLDNLSGFELTHSRRALAEDLGRFTGASMIAELALRFGHETEDHPLFDAVAQALDDIALAAPERAAVTTLASAWRIVAELGVAPTLEQCGECHAPLDAGLTTLFSHRAGGALCARCGRLAPAGRVLPPDARAVLGRLLRGDADLTLDDAALRAHQRLLREFLAEHLSEGRPLTALELWEGTRW